MPAVSVAIGVDHVAMVEFSRGPSNFFDFDLIDTLATTLRHLADGSVARAVLLCSTGRHFCAGADFSSPEDALTSAQSGQHLYDAAARLFDQPLPIVAAVQGAAVGGGLGLALAADFRVASSDARFWAPFASLGVTQGFGLSVTLPRTVGHQRAQDLLLTARRVQAAEALELGLVDRVVDPGRLRAEARALAASIAEKAPLAVRGIRELLREQLLVDVRRAMAAERAHQEALFSTEDHTEGVAASLERRPPRFTGS